MDSIQTVKIAFFDYIFHSQLYFDIIFHIYICNVPSKQHKSLNSCTKHVQSSVKHHGSQATKNARYNHKRPTIKAIKQLQSRRTTFDQERAELHNRGGMLEHQSQNQILYLADVNNNISVSNIGEDTNDSDHVSEFESELNIGELNTTRNILILY